MTRWLRITAAWLALLSIVGATGYLFMSDTLGALADSRHTLARQKALLARLQAMPDRKDIVSGELETLKKTILDQELYRGRSNAVQSLIQRDLRQLAFGVGLRLSTMRGLGAVRDSGQVEEVAVSLNFNTTQELLIQYLQVVEARKPILIIRKLNIRIQRPATATQPAVLLVMMEVTGFRATEEAKS